jgi:hypothetical protein
MRVSSGYSCKEKSSKANGAARREIRRGFVGARYIVPGAALRTVSHERCVACLGLRAMAKARQARLPGTIYRAPTTPSRAIDFRGWDPVAKDVCRARHAVPLRRQTFWLFAGRKIVQGEWRGAAGNSPGLCRGVALLRPANVLGDISPFPGNRPPVTWCS